MVVYAGFRNLQGATVPPQCQLTSNLFGARLEDQLHQLAVTLEQVEHCSVE